MCLGATNDLLQARGKTRVSGTTSVLGIHKNLFDKSFYTFNTNSLLAQYIFSSKIVVLMQFMFFFTKVNKCFNKKNFLMF